MLKHRLLFGTLMVVFFTGVVILDDPVSTSVGDKKIQATLLCILIMLLSIGANLELAGLFSKTGVRIFRPVTIIGSILLAGSWYWRQFYSNPVEFHLYYVLFVSAFSLLGLFLYHGLRLGAVGAVGNCGANYLMIFYLGFLSGFVLGVRIDFGLWALLMFIFTVKSSDIGAYTAGRFFGRRKFSPNISPGKTWEGIAGGVIFASIVAVIFSVCCGIMTWYSAVVFGVMFAFLGQLADLAESMIKRDAEQKDSANSVPGFGGILDVIDSVLATAPAAYVFFMFVNG